MISPYLLFWFQHHYICLKFLYRFRSKYSKLIDHIRHGSHTHVVSTRVQHQKWRVRTLRYQCMTMVAEQAEILIPNLIATHLSKWIPHDYHELNQAHTWGDVLKRLYIYIYIYYDKGRQKKSDAEPLFGQEIQLSFFGLFPIFPFLSYIFKKKSPTLKKLNYHYPTFHTPCSFSVNSHYLRGHKFFYQRNINAALSLP